MFHSKILLLITFASQACLAREAWQDHLLNGECDSFKNAVQGIWSKEKHRLEKTITQNYKGDIKMAENIYNCVTSIIWGTSFEVYQDLMIGFLALYRMLYLEHQELTNVAVKMVIRMNEAATLLETSPERFPAPKREILKSYVQQFKDEMLPTHKSVNFDKWVYIKHPYDSWYLAMYDGKVDMWPLNAHVLIDNSFKWYVNRTFDIDQNKAFVLQVMFTHVLHKNVVLASNANGEVVVTKDTNNGYHLWNVEFVQLKHDAAGVVRFKNLITGKYLKSDVCCSTVANSQRYKIVSMTTDTESGINLILH